MQSFSQHPKIGPYWRLVRMDKPVGTYLILWPSMWGLWLAAEGIPSLYLLLVFALGSLLMRSAGCAINDYADRHIDGQIERTKNRPLATGELSPKQALLTFAALCGAAFVLVLTTNLLTIMLAFVGAALAAIYPFLKRVTHLPQVWLGLAMNWGAVMAFSAQSGTLEPGIFVVYAAAVLWTVVYDTFYAMVDREEDLQAGVKSIAILFGEQDRMMTGILQALSLFAFFVAGQRFELGAGYFWMLWGIFALFCYQQFLIRDRKPQGCFNAFMNNRWLGPWVLAAIWMGQGG